MGQCHRRIISFQGLQIFLLWILTPVRELTPHTTSVGSVDVLRVDQTEPTTARYILDYYFYFLHYQV